MIKESLYLEDIIISNVYSSNKRHAKYMKQKLTEPIFSKMQIEPTRR